MNYFDFGSVGPPMLFIAISLLLAHFFNDADQHRSFLERLRAKYILHKRGPIEYLIENDNFESRRHIYEELLSFRSARIHFSIITLIILLGLVVSIAIIIHALIYCSEHGLGFLCVSLISIGAMMIIVLAAFIYQQRGTARRLDELQTTPLSVYGSVASQYYEIIGSEVEVPHGLSHTASGFFINLFK